MFDDDDAGAGAGAGAGPALSLAEYGDICNEIDQQPEWRGTADKEMDYADGNQLDSDLLRKQREAGVPPAIEDLIGPALLSIQGYESITRTDWRVTASGEPDGQDIADALNFRLNQAERESHADRACSAAFRSQIGCGLGWVEVSRESNPFKYPYRCLPIHRNEIHWDMQAREDDLSDARWLRRQRWMRPEQVAMAFPQYTDQIMQTGKAGSLWWGDVGQLDGGSSTGLQNAWANGRAWTHQEERWYNTATKEVCVAEIWYRRWESVAVLKGGIRAVEYDPDNPAHDALIAAGAVQVIKAVVPRVRYSYWLGPNRLFDGQSPYAHPYFPYVPFWGFREDTTGVPYGYVRGMKYAQDSLNSVLSKLRWAMNVTRVERTKGAIDMTDAQLRRQVARPDSDIVLNSEHMARPGARFEVKRDYQLTDQHYQLLQDSRTTIERVSNITSGFMGRRGNATSGLQEQTQVEQSNQSLAHILDLFRAARTQMGELLLSMLINDMGGEPQSIVVEGDAVRPDRTVVINKPETDPETGLPYLSNDLQNTRLKVALEDVPSTNSYRGQQLNAMSEAVKSMPSQYQAAVMPFLVSLMDVPFKREVIEAIRQAQQQATPEQIKQQQDQAVQDALAKSGNDIKLRELELKERRADSEIRQIDAQSVQVGVQAAFSAMQAGAQIAQMPAIAPIADAVMKASGYRAPTPAGQDPDFPVPEGADSPAAQFEASNAPPVHKNTSPAYPPVPQKPGDGMEGIETPRAEDNLQ